MGSMKFAIFWLLFAVFITNISAKENNTESTTKPPDNHQQQDETHEEEQKVEKVDENKVESGRRSGCTDNVTQKPDKEYETQLREYKMYEDYDSQNSSQEVEDNHLEQAEINSLSSDQDIYADYGDTENQDLKFYDEEITYDDEPQFDYEKTAQEAKRVFENMDLMGQQYKSDLNSQIKRTIYTPIEDLMMAHHLKKLLEEEPEPEPESLFGRRSHYQQSMQNLNQQQQYQQNMENQWNNLPPNIDQFNQQTFDSQFNPPQPQQNFDYFWNQPQYDQNSWNQDRRKSFLLNQNEFERDWWLKGVDGNKITKPLQVKWLPQRF